jgi:hypothetical protein
MEISSGSPCGEIAFESPRPCILATSAYIMGQPPNLDTCNKSFSDPVDFDLQCISPKATS